MDAATRVSKLRLQRGQQADAARVLLECCGQEGHMTLYLPHTSPIPRPHLPYTSPTSPHAIVDSPLHAIVDSLGTQVCENTGSSGDSTRQTVLLSGVFLGGVQVFAIVNLRTESAKNVGMRLTVRSTDMQISQFVAASVA